MTYLQITLNVAASNRSAAGAIYAKYRQPFLTTIDGALNKQLLMREADVQVMHEFSDVESANAYLKSSLFNSDVVRELGPLLASEPDIRIYDTPA